MQILSINMVKDKIEKVHACDKNKSSRYFAQLIAYNNFYAVKSILQ